MGRLSKFQIEEILAKKNLKAIDISGYENLKSDITVECDMGHKFVSNLDTIRKAKFRCPSCHGGQMKVSNSAAVPQKKGQRIIAFDNATEKVGVSIFDDGVLVYYNLLKFSGSLDDRMVRIWEVFTQVVIPQWQPDYLIFEDIQYQGNYQTYKTLAMLQGILRVAAKKANIKFEIVYVNTWRSHFQIVEKNRAKAKAKSIAKVKDMYGLNANDDVAEAILLGKYAVDEIGYKMVKKAF